MLKALAKGLTRAADPVQKWVSVFAILVGGYWAYHRFIAEDTYEMNPEMTISTEILPYTDSLRLLVVHAYPKNIGKVPIEIPTDHFWIEIRKVPENLKAGYVDAKKLPVAYKTSDIANVDGGYWLEPGVAYDEARSFVVSAGTTFAITAEFDYDDTDGDEVDVTGFSRVN